MSPSSVSREYDVVVYGATGYTGRLCAEVLARHPTKPRWAIAGRDESRLKALREKLSLPSTVGTIEANNNDVGSLHAMLKRTKAIVNVVGPFREMGAEKIVSACTKTSTHYFDLSGETGFNATVSTYDRAAKSAGIVLACSVGLDCLPFDLSTYLAVQHLHQEQKEQVGEVNVGCLMKGGLSGGTILSAMDMVEIDKTQMQKVRPDWLSPLKSRYKPFQSWSPFFFAPFKAHAIFTPFTIHNTRLINQTHGILEKAQSGDQYGPTFTYKDGFIVGNSIVAWIATTILRISLFFQLYVSPLRWLIRKVIPRNYGPSTENMWSEKQAFMDLVAIAYNVQKTKASLCRMYAPGEPGYSSTAQMIVECALLVVQEPNSLHPLAAKGGVMTGALLGPDRLAERLVENAKWTIERAQPYDGKSPVSRIKKAQ